MEQPVSIVLPSIRRFFLRHHPKKRGSFQLRVSCFVRQRLERFVRLEVASGLVLLAATVFALAWANSPWAGSYASLWQMPIGIRDGALAFERPLAWLVNDGLMVIFFFVGMEIRREAYRGVLSEWRSAVLPVAIARPFDS